MYPEAPSAETNAAVERILGDHAGNGNPWNVLGEKIAATLFVEAPHGALIKDGEAIGDVFENWADGGATVTWSACGEEAYQAARDVIFENVRPPREKAEAAIEAFLETELGCSPDITLTEDGDNAWAFYIKDEDTTSYVHPDLTIEWNGTSYDPTDPDDVEDYGGGYGNDGPENDSDENEDSENEDNENETPAP